MKIDLNDVISGNTTSNHKNHMNLKEKNPPDLKSFKSTMNLKEKNPPYLTTESDKNRNFQPITHG